VVADHSHHDFQLPMPFRSPLGVIHGTDRRTNDAHQRAVGITIMATLPCGEQSHVYPNYFDTIPALLILTEEENVIACQKNTYQPTGNQ